MADMTRGVGPQEAQVENVHVRELIPIFTPDEVKSAYPATESSLATVTAGREAVRTVLLQPDRSDRLVAIVGPCSIHDRAEALEYAAWLKEQRQIYGDELEILMRVYFEKPRTTIGWEGYINDPGLDETYNINGGLMLSRELIRDVTDMGVPVATELLDTTTPQYFAGLVSWGAIGARTTESPLHRQLASGLSFPVGFKNGTSGNIQTAVDAITSAKHPHHFLAVTDEGKVAIAKTSGNPDCHVVLRGGPDQTNYDAESIAKAIGLLAKAGLAPHVMIDYSHANSGKDPNKQHVVAESIALQISRGSTAIMGFMIESNLKPGAQPFNPTGVHEHGISITDGCIGLDDTSAVLRLMANAVTDRRRT